MSAKSTRSFAKNWFGKKIPVAVYEKNTEGLELLELWTFVSLTVSFFATSLIVHTF